MQAIRPSACADCSYLDAFHSTCAHPFRQIAIRELYPEGGPCPVEPVRSE